MQLKAFLFCLFVGAALLLHPTSLKAALSVQSAEDRAPSTYQILPTYFSFTNNIKPIVKEKTVSDYSNFAFEQNYLNSGTMLDVFLTRYFVKAAASELKTQLFYFYTSVSSFYRLASNPWNYYLVPYGYCLNLSYSFSSYQLGLTLQYQLDY